MVKKKLESTKNARDFWPNVGLWLLYEELDSEIFCLGWSSMLPLKYDCRKVVSELKVGIIQT